MQEDESEDFFCSSIRRGQVELGCHIDEKTLLYLPETVYLVIYDAEEVPFDFAYGTDEIYAMVDSYFPDSPFYLDIHRCMQLGHIIEWV